MKSPHLFALWFMAKRLRPELVVESGVLRGQSTWLLEQACPEAKLICIDPALEKRTYISDRAVYSPKDFTEHDWADVPERSLAFFDDHQNAYLRIQQCAWFGFRHVIFEDNYPPGHGDCYSLKKAFAGAGHAQNDGAVQPAGGSLARVSDALRRRLGSSGRKASQPAWIRALPRTRTTRKCSRGAWRFTGSFHLYSNQRKRAGVTIGRTKPIRRRIRCLPSRRSRPTRCIWTRPCFTHGFATHSFASGPCQS